MLSLALPIPFGLALIFAALFLPKKRALWVNILSPIAVIPIAVAYVLISGATDNHLGWSFVFAQTLFFSLIPFSLVGIAIVLWRNRGAY